MWTTIIALLETTLKIVQQWLALQVVKTKLETHKLLYDTDQAEIAKGDEIRKTIDAATTAGDLSALSVFIDDKANAILIAAGAGSKIQDSTGRIDLGISGGIPTPATPGSGPSGSQQPIASTVATVAGSVNLSSAAKSNAGTLSSSHVEGDENGALGCAWSVSTILAGLGMPFTVTLSTSDLFTQLKSRWVLVDPVTPGSVIISPTVGEKHGHAGIVGAGGLVYSNSSASGLWTQNYTVPAWKTYFTGSEGLQTFAFAPPVTPAVIGTIPPVIVVPVVAQVPSHTIPAAPYSVTGTATWFGWNPPTKDNPQGTDDTGDQDKLGNDLLGAFGDNCHNEQLVGISIPIPIFKATIGTDDCVYKDIANRRYLFDIWCHSTGRHATGVWLVDLGPSASLNRVADMTYGLGVMMGLNDKAIITWSVTDTHTGKILEIKGYDFVNNEVIV